MKRERKSARKPIPVQVEQAVLAKSARRCTLCFGLSRDLMEKRGQIAHLDCDRNNNSEANLAWMCLDHHSLFDSRTSQHKNYTITEVKNYRKRLYELVVRDQHLRSQVSDDTGGKKTDRKTLDNLIESLAESMKFIRAHNFGFSFKEDKLDGFDQFINRDEPQHEFIDEELEQLRKAFYEACANQAGLIATYTFPDRNTDRQGVPSEWEIEQPDRFLNAVSEIHAAGDLVCESYDKLVRTARRKLLQ